MAAISSFADLLSAARQPAPPRVAIAGADDVEVLRSAVECRRLSLAEPILVGPEACLRRQAAEAGIDLAGYGVINRNGAAPIARATMEVVRSGEAQVAVKGVVSSSAFLHAALDRTCGLRTDRLVSHVGVFQIPGFPRLICISDGGVVLFPDLEQKAAIIENAVGVAQALGIGTPRVALLAGTNQVTLERPVTREIAGLVAMTSLWDSLGAQVGGPFTPDVAVDPVAAAAAGAAGPVAGQADILIGPTLEASNTMAKAITYFAGGQMAGLVVGTSAPLALGSRSDPAESRLACIAAGVLFASSARA